MAESLIFVQNYCMGQEIPFEHLKTDDIMAYALMQYHLHQTNKVLWVRTNHTDFDEYHLPYFFRTWKEMPLLEQKALELSNGRVLDVGAGTGIHALELQKIGIECKAIDISELSVRIMKDRGVQNAEHIDFYKLTDEKFDTLLFLMNGIGLVKRMSGFKNFFKKCKELLNPGGQILFDSSDLIYLFEEEDGSFLIDLNEHYYGEVDFEVKFDGITSKPFPWLFIDFDNFQFQAEKYGFQAELIETGAHYDYLARVMQKEEI